MEWDFVENSAVADVNSVPEQFRGFYVEGDDGKYIVNPDVMPLAEAYTGVSKKARKLEADRSAANKEAADRRGELGKFSALVDEMGLEIPEGVDPKDTAGVLKHAFDDLTNRVKNGKDIKVDMDKVRAESERRIKEVQDSSEAEKAAMLQSLHKYMVGRDAALALAQAGVVEKGANLLMPQIMESAKVLKDDNGEFVVRIVDADGNSRSDGKGGFMSVGDLVAEFRSEYPMAFKSDTPGGSGTPPGRQSNAKPGAGGEDKSSVSKISAGLANLKR
jgi:hypothetical protein